MKPSERERWRVTVIADDDGDPPAALRVKKWLKNALRSFGLRCIWMDSGEASENTEAREIEIRIHDET